MIVEVTQADIDKGQPGQADRCPIAIALQRLGFTDAEVELDRWMSIGKDGYFSNEGVSLPIAARTFVVSYDAGEPVQPFRFRTRKPR